MFQIVQDALAKGRGGSRRARVYYVRECHWAVMSEEFALFDFGRGVLL